MSGSGAEGCRERISALGCAVLIPTYNNAATLERVISEVKDYARDIVVVNDGSTDDTGRILSAIKGIEVISYIPNKGKGYALKTGLRYCADRGFRYALTIDSDGQHEPGDIPVFLDAAESECAEDIFLIGARNLRQDNMPSKNTFANKFSNFWFHLETGIKLEDTQSGYRLYPLNEMKGMRFVTSRYEFELEAAVRAAWKGVPVKNVPIRVYYAPHGERVSHFRPLRDFARISLLNCGLMSVALLFYYPFKFLRWLTWENVRLFVRKYITRSPESNLKVSQAIALGIFWGLSPAWGFQIILAGVTAHFLRLNKVIAVISSNISIPPLIPFILYGSYVFGGLVLGRPATLSLHEMSLEVLGGSLLQYLAGSVILSVICSLFLGAVSFLLLSVYRKNPEHE